MNVMTVLAIASTLAVGGGVTAAAANRAHARTVTVESGQLEQSLIATATVAPVDGVIDVHPRVDGRVARVLVKEGDRVAKDALLAEIEPEEYATTLDRLRSEKKSQLSVAQAGVRAAQRSYDAAAERAKKLQVLVGKGAESSASLDDAGAARDVAAAEVARAIAQRDLTRGGARKLGDSAIDDAKRRLEWTRLVAPAAGVVLTRRIDPGDIVGAGRGSGAAFEIANPDETEVLVELDEADAARVVPGLAATIVVPGTRQQLGTGTIARVGGALHKRTIGAHDARLRADGTVRSAWLKWSDGARPSLPLFSRLEAVVKLSPQPVKARVPRSAIAVQDGRATVSVPFGPLSRERAVLLGAADEAWVELRDVAPGTRVLAR